MLVDDDDGDEASFWSVLEDVEEGMEVTFYLFVMDLWLVVVILYIYQSKF